MPVFQRKAIRHHLGLNRLGTTLIGTTVLSLGANASLNVLDRTFANPEFSGHGLHVNSWMRVASVTYRVGSFNAPSGAFVSGQLIINAIASGADFELTRDLAPEDMDRMIDETILRLRVRREVGIPTVEGAAFYTLDNAASPNTIINIMRVYYFADPSNSQNRDRREFPEHGIVTTATGLELRIERGLAASQQIVLDALLQLSLGIGDAATINLPDEETILWGAAARAYDLQMRTAARDARDRLRQDRADAARQFSRLAQLFFPETTKELTFEQRAGGLGPLDDWSG